MLATVKHECAGTWQPIAEDGKGKGRKYGTPDPVTGQVYYGRGYVQLTWKANYQAMSKVTGADLVNHPELALTAPVAYRIMEYGMRNGSFTGVGLKKYIHEDVCDYLNARRIINGIDCAELIANYAKTIQGILEQSRVEKG
jgi:predicted chitinase